MSVQQFQEDYAHPLFVYRPSGKQHWWAQRYFTNIIIPAKDIDNWIGRQAPERKHSSSNEKRCEEWLRSLASSRELSKPLVETQTVPSKEHWWVKAFKQFPGLSKRQFERAWSGVAKDFPKISAPGRKAQSPRKSAQ
jgi:hypothetical protein